MKKYIVISILGMAAMLLVSCNVKTTEQTTTQTIEERNDSQGAAFQIFFVRHAEKSDNDPRDPDLNAAGQARAQKLKYHLAKAGITKIYSTEYKRTQQTVAPLAKALGIQVENYATDLRSITEDLKTATGGNILVVGHSNTTPKLISKLLEQESYEKLDESVYNKLFVLIKSGDQFRATTLQF